MHIFYQPLLDEGVLYLNPDESKHAVKVLRLREGDTIEVVDGQGGFYKVRITEADPKECAFEVLEKKSSDHHPYYIHIAIAPTKNMDRLEWFIEKAVEFGIDEISLILCEHSERKVVKTERLQRKAVSAMKQSIKAYMPKINEAIKYSTFMEKIAEDEQLMIAYVDQTIPEHLKDKALPKARYCVLIGPEGDFSEKEIQLAFQKEFEAVSLGKSRLRTETAGVAACHILNLIND